MRCLNFTAQVKALNTAAQNLILYFNYSVVFSEQNNDSVWLGATFEKKFGAFVWTATRKEFTNWKEKQPDNKGGKEVSCRKLDRDVMFGILNLPVKAKPVCCVFRPAKSCSACRSLV